MSGRIGGGDYSSCHAYQANKVSEASNAPISETTEVRPTVPITRTVEVSDAAGLKDALANATPGTEIKLADGVYEGRFELNNKDGVTISGSKDAVLKGDGTGYGLHLNNSDNNTLTGFTVTDSKKGIMLDNSSNNMLNGLTVDRIGQEGIHFRTNSSNNVLQNSFIDNTGLITPGYGEGVYIGSALSNMANDRSNGNKILNNAFGAGITAENIDVKQGTSGGVIEGNRFNVDGPMGAREDSAVSLKGGARDYVVQGNQTTGDGTNFNIRTFGNTASENTVRDNEWDRI